MSGLASIFDPANAEKFKRVDKPVAAPRPRKPKSAVIDGVDSEAVVNGKKRSLTGADDEESEKKKKPKHEKRKLVAINKKKEEKGEDALDAVEKSFIAASRAQRPVEQLEAMEVEELADAEAGKTENPEDEGDAAKNDRTLFAGNIPVSYDVKKLKTYFKEFGSIESVRLRSVPYEGIAVDQPGNQLLVRKVAINSGKIGSQKGSLNAYIVFEKEESVTLALAANNRMIGDRHLRVDRCTPTLFDPKSTVFIGGLPYYADEEKLREHFAAVLPNGQDDIVNVRIVRDPASLVCKGVGYILLSGTDAVFKALTLNKVAFKKRELRVSTCGKRTKRTDDKKPNNSTEGGDGTPKKKVKKAKELKGAARRVEARVKAKREVLGRKKAKKNSKPKKTKQLGGVIKRAIKMTKQAKV